METEKITNLLRFGRPTKESTTAERLLFHLQWAGTMWQCGRDKLGDESYIEAQKLAQQLIDEGH